MEFAISLVILLVLVSGIVDFGRAFFSFVTLNDAAKEGATYASICPTDISGIFARLIESASDPITLHDLNSDDISICVSAPGSEDCSANIQVGNEVTVFVNYEHTLSTPLPGDDPRPAGSAADGLCPRQDPAHHLHLQLSVGRGDIVFH